jgi:hypothetical protein
MGESRVLVLGFVTGEVATAGSAFSGSVLEELAAGGEEGLGLTILGLRARVLGGAACNSGAGEATPWERVFGAMTLCQCGRCCC